MSATDNRVDVLGFASLTITPVDVGSVFVRDAHTPIWNRVQSENGAALDIIMGITDAHDS